MSQRGRGSAEQTANPDRHWTSPADVRRRVRKSWDSGRLLSSMVACSATGSPVAGSPTGPPEPGDAVFPLRVPLTGPRSAELAERWSDARDWVDRHEHATGYRVEWRTVNDRALGRQRLPAVAWIDTVDAAAALCGTTRALAQFRAALDVTPPEMREWVGRHPHKVLDVGDDWPLLLKVVRWLAEHPDPQVYLRQVDVPGLHTKVIEAHRRTIASMADAVGVAGLPTEGHGWFERRYGFRTKPTLVRLRALDHSARLVGSLSDMALRVEEAANVTPPLRRVFIVENEINYLSFPEVPESIVIFGQGNEAPTVLGGLPWLRDVQCWYFGDLDTHGFAILDRVRGVLPDIRSLLMDRDTLLAHRHAWTTEPSQSSRTMTRLTPDEAALVESLRGAEFGERVRLEQERIGWSWLVAEVANAG